MDNQNIISTNTNQPATQFQQKSKSKGWLIAALSFLALIGGCFGIYGMFFRSQTNAPSENRSNENSQDGAAPDAYVVRDLRNKTFRLLGYRNGLSVRDYYHSDDGTFLIYQGYMPVNQLLENSLTDAIKTYITLETTVLGKEKYCSYELTDGVKADIDAAIQSYYGRRNIDFGGITFECISYDDANRDYFDLFGGNIPKIVNGDYAYGANLDAYYYHIIGGRGGTSSSYVVGRVDQILETNDYAYVEISAATFGVNAGEAGWLYSDIEATTQLRSLEYDNINWDGLGLNDEDFLSFQSYRFVYQKNKDGIYSFVRVEKI